MEVLRSLVPQLDSGGVKVTGPLSDELDHHRVEVVGGVEHYAVPGLGDQLQVGLKQGNIFSPT